MKNFAVIDHPGLLLDSVLQVALIKTIEASEPSLNHLPIPVRFRATGALRAWHAVFDALPSTAEARRALADTSVAPATAGMKLTAGLERHLLVAERAKPVIMPVLESLLRTATNLLAFWLRNGMVYEPTAPLDRLLEGVDVSHDLASRWLQPPSSAVCIARTGGDSRNRQGPALATLVFAHAGPAAPQHAPRPARRCLTVLMLRSTREGIDTTELVLPVYDEDTPLAATLADALDGGGLIANAPDQPESDASSYAREEQQQQLDYAVKLLLYLNLDDATLHAALPYKQALKELLAMTYHERRQRIVEIQQIYDRYVVGPSTIVSWAGEHAAQLGPGNGLPQHWRRGLFAQRSDGASPTSRALSLNVPTARGPALPAGEFRMSAAA